jgi:hypothetical protein
MNGLRHREEEDMRLKLQKTKHYKIIFNLTFPKLHLGKDKGTKKQKKKKQW